MADTPEDDVVAELTPEPVPVGSSRRRRALALWGVLAVIAVGAGLLVVQSHDDDPPRLPIALGAAAGGAAKESATMAAPSADMSMFRAVTYVAGDDLPLLGGSAAAYRLRSDITVDQVRTLGRALGLTGEPKQGNGHWTLATDDGRLEVDSGGGGTWWFNTGESANVSSGSSSGSAGGGVAVPPDVVLDSPASDVPPTPLTTLAGDQPVESCPENAKCAAPTPYVPPADLPSEAEARAKALDLLRSVGADIDDAVVHVDGPYEGWYITVEPRVDGMVAAGLSYSVEVGPKGVIRSAGGNLARPDRLGEYPVLDTRATIDRLNEQSVVAYGAAEDLKVLDTPMCETATASGSGVAGSDVAASDVTTMECAASPPLPTEPYVPPEPQTIVLHGAERVLVVVYASDGSNDAYLVPGYRFTGDEGTVIDQVAVDDDSLVPPAPVPETPKVFPTDPGEVRPVEPAVGEPK